MAIFELSKELKKKIIQSMNGQEDPDWSAEAVPRNKARKQIKLAVQIIQVIQKKFEDYEATCIGGSFPSAQPDSESFPDFRMPSELKACIRL